MRRAIKFVSEAIVRQNFSFPSCKSLKTEEVKGAVRFVGEFLLRLFERSSARSHHHGQQRGAQQGQRAGTVGMAQPALVLAADHVAPPVDLVFHSPVTADLLGQLRGRRFVGSQADGEVARARLVLPTGFMGLLALQADQLRDVRIGRRLRLNAHRAQRAFADETARAFAVGKRGGVESSLWCAKACRVGWLSLSAPIQSPPF